MALRSVQEQYSKTCLKRPLKKDQKLVFKTDYHLMQDKSIAECSMGSILQYFWPSLSYHLSLRPSFCLFLSGCLRQVLLYDLITDGCDATEWLSKATLTLKASITTAADGKFCNIFPKIQKK